MTAGIVELPNAMQALLAAAGFLISSCALRAVIPPLWAAYPALRMAMLTRCRGCAAMSPPAAHQLR